ncbi:TPA: spore coat U domain-containing protein [Pseudomonas aeruginosa]|nr:spore coat U domain-containing protein [Pseudomonas aeruginosa]
MSRHSTSACLLGFATLCASPLLLAACTTSSGTGNFGSLSSFTVASTAQTITGTTGFKCTGSLLSILSTNTIDATITSTANPLGTTPRLYNAASGTYLPYSICKDNGCGTVYNVGSTVRWSSTTFLGILGLFNATDGSLPLYLRTATGVTLPAGTYTDTIGLNWAWHLCAAGIGPVCVYDDGTASSSVNVTLTVLKDCFIDSAPDLSFGSAALVSAFTAVNQNIGVRCTLNATYTIGFDNGNNFSGGWRRMLSGANAIQYNLYKPGDSTVWTTSNTQAGTGSGAAQNVPYRAIVNPAQGNVPAGTYSDTVRVILTY